MFSSQVIQVPQGVRPPAQFRTVPAIEGKCLSRRPRLSNTSVVVPPRQAGSYIFSGGALTIVPLPGDSSWLRTRMVVPRLPAKAAIPS